MDREDPKHIERIADGIIRIGGDLSLGELYPEIGNHEVLVEPLSETVALGTFLLQGGLGYGSLVEGTFASHVYSFKSKAFKIPFEYGRMYSTLYSAGYPLHRIAQGSGLPGMGGLRLLGEDVFAPPEELIIPIRPAMRRIVRYEAGAVDAKPPANGATNVLFVNEVGAQHMGLTDAGWVWTYPAEGRSESAEPGEAQTGDALDDIWARRFVVDRIPPRHGLLRLLTMESRVSEVFALFNAEGKEGLFFALSVHLGVLVLMSSEDRHRLEDIGARCADIPLTFVMGIH